MSHPSRGFVVARPVARKELRPDHANSSRRFVAARLSALIAVMFAAAPPSTLAQGMAPPSAEKLDPVSVTATRGMQPVADLLADVTVLGPDDIARAGAQSLTELLQRQPGVEIVQNGGPGSVSGVLLRGANRGQTLMLIEDRKSVV